GEHSWRRTLRGISPKLNSLTIMENEIYLPLLAEDFDHLLGPRTKGRALRNRALTDHGGNFARRGRHHFNVFDGPVRKNCETQVHPRRGVDGLEKFDFLIPPGLQRGVKLLLVFAKFTEGCVDRELPVPPGG